MTSPSKNPVNWFEIYVDDIERAKKFYAEVLQISFQDAETPHGKMAFFPFSEDCNAPNACGALYQMTHFVRAGGNSVLVYFQCDDCQVEQDRVEAAGGKVLFPKMDIGEHGFCACCEDSEGNSFGLHSMK